MPYNEAVLSLGRHRDDIDARVQSREFLTPFRTNFKYMEIIQGSVDETERVYLL